MAGRERAHAVKLLSVSLTVQHCSASLHMPRQRGESLSKFQPTENHEEPAYPQTCCPPPPAPRCTCCSGLTRAKVSFKHQGHSTLPQPSRANSSICNERHHYAIIPPPSSQYHHLALQSLLLELQRRTLFTSLLHSYPLTSQHLNVKFDLFFFLLYGVKSVLCVFFCGVIKT